MHENGLWKVVVQHEMFSPICCRHACIRVDNSSHDFCIKYYIVFRRHLFGPEQTAENCSLLDEFGLQRVIQYRDDFKVDRPWIQQVFHKLLDGS